MNSSNAAQLAIMCTSRIICVVHAGHGRAIMQLVTKREFIGRSVKVRR
jgi:hypothetical protein